MTWIIPTMWSLRSARSRRLVPRISSSSIRIRVTIGDDTEDPEPPVDPDPEVKVDLMLDGVLYGSIGVKDGKLTGELPVPMKDGWNFEGWYTEDGAKFDPTQPIEGSLVLVAKWSRAATPLEPSTPVEPTPKPKPNTTTPNGLPQTGDAAMLLVAGSGITGAACAAAGVYAARRRR